MEAMQIARLRALGIVISLGAPPLLGNSPDLPPLPQINMANFLSAIRRQVEEVYAAPRCQTGNRKIGASVRRPPASTTRDRIL